MTEDTRPHGEISPQDEALLTLLDGADSGVDPTRTGAGSDLDRATLETLGLMASSLDPAPVSDGARADLFARLGLEHRSAGAAPSSLGELPATETSTVRAFPTAPPPVRSSNLASWALAATVLLALGLALWGGFMWSEVRQSRTVIASLSEELDRMTEQSADFQQVRFENQQLRSHLATAVQPHAQVCALNAVAADQPQAKGAVFLSPDNGRWVLAASNLAKCQLGRRYRLWFLDEDGRYSGGEMLEHVNGEAEVELAAGDLPEGTQAILLTLEFPDQFGPEPAGERVLFGDRTVEVY